MKKITLLILLSVFILQLRSQNVLSGYVRDNSGTSLPGATIYAHDLKTGTATNDSGYFRIERLPKGNFLFEVRSIGFETATISINIDGNTTHDIILESHIIECPGVVITGSPFASSNKKNSITVSSISREEMRLNPSSNVIGKITSVPGVSDISTGGAISKPVIRGLGYNHVITLNEGVRQEGQQWGDEHGIEIDQFGVERVEIMKGPASLLYGSDAMGGVINFLEPVPPAPGEINGEAETEFSTNGNLSANSVMAEGNHQGFTWRARGSYKSAGNYSTRKEKIYNSLFNEKNGNAMIGYNGSWGFSRIYFSSFNARAGMIEGERDSLTGKLLNHDGLIATDPDLNGREFYLPFQQIGHLKVSSVNNIIAGNGQLRINAGFQQNDRQEFEESNTDPGIHLILNTTTFDIKYRFPVKNELEPVFGIASMIQKSSNLGTEYLIPDHNLFDAGAFFYLKKSFKKLAVNGGIRYDQREISSEKLFLDSLGVKSETGDTIFNGFKTSFGAVSASAGMAFPVNELLLLKANVGRGYRAPNISELSSNGVHEGTFRYEKGNSNLKPETSLQFDGEIGIELKKISISLSGFHNTIDNFIYKRNTGNEKTEAEGDSFSVYRFVQGRSVLTGFESTIDFHPLDALHFYQSFAIVKGKNMETKTDLPFIPQARIRHEIKWEIRSSKKFLEPFIRTGNITVFAQENIDPEFETTTDGYSLFYAGAGFGFKVKKQEIIFSVTASNLLNKGYYDHLSRLKQVGIQNQGRNVIFHLTLPVGFRK